MEGGRRAGEDWRRERQTSVCWRMGWKGLVSGMRREGTTEERGKDDERITIHCFHVVRER